MNKRLAVITAIALTAALGVTGCGAEKSKTSSSAAASTASSTPPADSAGSETSTPPAAADSVSPAASTEPASAAVTSPATVSSAPASSPAESSAASPAASPKASAVTGGKPGDFCEVIEGFLDASTTLTKQDLAAAYRTFAGRARQSAPAEIRAQALLAADVMENLAALLEAGKLPAPGDAMGNTPEQRKAVNDVFLWTGAHCP